MDRLLLFVVLIFATFAAQPTVAQQFSVQTDRAAIGGLVPVQLVVPEDENNTNFQLGITRVGSDDMRSTHHQRGPYQGAVTLKVPNIPGRYQVVLRRASDGAVVQRAPLMAVFSPAPGALRLSSSIGTAGGKITATVRFPAGRYLSQPWVGFFRLGKNTTGGASIADERLSGRDVPAEGGTVTLTLPRWADRYELRLFDRRHGTFVLDTAQVDVAIKPMTGALSLDKETYEISTVLTSTVTLDGPRHFENAWVGLYRPERAQSNGQIRAEERLGWGWAREGQPNNTFRIPSRPGVYEIRLFDRNSGDLRYELDRISFRVVASPQPDAIKLSQTDYIVGAPIDISVLLDQTREYHDPWIGLFDSARTPSAGNAPREEHRYGWSWVRNAEPMRFVAPGWPGTYQFRVYDRNRRYYVLDTIDINVTAPPTPGVIEMVKTLVDIGEPIKLKVRLPEGRFFSSPLVAIYTDPSAATAARSGNTGGAPATEERVLWKWITSDEEITVGAINTPGTYEVRVYDRNGHAFILDRTQVTVQIPETPDVLSLDKEVYRPGSKITVAVEIPEGRFSRSPWIGIVRDDTQEHANAKLGSAHVKHHTWIKPGEGPYVLTAPTIWGSYRVVAMDRQEGGVWIGDKVFRVEPRRENLMRISGRQFAPGETFKVQVRWPEGLPLGAPKVTLHSSSYITEGGGLVVERPLSTHHIRERDEIVELKAPKQAGKYELRFVDRNRAYYILDIEPFVVVDAGLAPPVQTLHRLTPMPGEGRTTPLQTPSAPASAETSSTQPSAEPNAGATAGAQPTETPAETPSETTPSDTEPSGETTAEAELDAGAAKLSILVVGPGGLTEISRINLGQTFIIRARFEAPPEAATLTAQLSLAPGHAASITLRRGDGGVYQSGIVRMPDSIGEAQ